MPDPNKVTRRSVLGSCVGAAGGACAFVAGSSLSPDPASAQEDGKDQPAKTVDEAMGKIGNVKISRMLLGGNLVSGYMHARDLRYVNRLFRAYVDEKKIFETFALAEENGINTVLESGANLVQKYNRDHGGQMQIIPSIHPSLEQPEAKLKDEIKEKIDVGCAALYIWGVAGDQLAKAGEVDLIAKAVQLIQDQGIPAGVGGHSLEVPKQCEQHQVPCDFYVKTLHMDTYPSAVPKPLRKDFIWLDGGEGWNDNMWCIDPDETVQFMQGVAKPWIAFKVLAAGAIPPRQGFAHAFDSGADFIGVGMFDFQIKENCELVRRLVGRAKDRPRPWMA